MASRHRSRERALQMIFQWEASGDEPEQVVASYWNGLATEIGQPAPAEDQFANSLLHGVARRAKSLDDLIRKHASNWKLERMAAVDRNILRLAVFEMQQGDTAPVVAINEALELGRRFSGEKSARFLNGVLDAIRKTLERQSANAVE
ncbi:MAG: transcription antitermination factor NusB [Acidobacteria bacterium]|nr:transcription antitermination factor NusB [Acidobacteriota bacterium]